MPNELRKLPEHIGIIMDGNGRWAKRRGLPRMAGHKAGAANFRTIARYCNEIGIKYLTVYAFSTENWNRAKEEVDYLMKLFADYLEEALRDFRDENIVTRFIGDRSVLNELLQKRMAEAEWLSKNKTGMVLNIAINYGGRDELVYAARKLAQKAAAGEIKPEDITSDMISQGLYTAGQPDPDLIIRPSGEYRSSNFLVWQSAYSEYVFFDDVMWPEFSTEDLERAIDIYSKRDRRFGG